MMRKHTPLHDFWHRRIEGQIRHTIGRHPEWFTFKNARDAEACVNSLAKRIVGEIVAVANNGDDTAGNASLVSPGGGRKDVASCLSTGGSVTPRCAPSAPKHHQNFIAQEVLSYFRDKWIPTEMALPPDARKTLALYLSRAKEGNNLKSRAKVYVARYSGGEWRFVESTARHALSDRVIAWMPFPNAEHPAKIKQIDTKAENHMVNI